MSNTGVVRWFNPIKGYGFIQPDKGGKDIFVHVSALLDGLRKLSEGEKVRFNISSSGKDKVFAVNVQIEDENSAEGSDHDNN